MARQPGKHPAWLNLREEDSHDDGVYTLLFAAGGRADRPGGDPADGLSRPHRRHDRYSAGILPPLSADWQWRAAFLAGAIAAPFVFTNLGGTIEFAVPVATLPMIIGGFIVGAGVYFGSGCTSGHGVCGMARLSPRSIAATLVFMTAAFITVYVTRHVIGG